MESAATYGREKVKITDIKMHILGSQTPALVTSFDGLFKDSGPAGVIQYSLVRILTDSGIEGHYIVWPEVAMGRPNALVEMLRVMKPHLIGQDPRDREKLWQKLGALWYGQKGPAFAAVDIALWDIASKAAQMPIYKLLGGFRDKVLAYASGNVPRNQEDIVRIATDLKQRGYRAMKLHPIPIDACEALREAVGDDADLIYDAVLPHTREEAIKVGRDLERLDFYSYEAPLPPDEVEGYVKLSQKLDIPITVELLYPSQYREYVRRGAVEYLRTLSGIRGGITEMRKVASLCEAFGMNREPHSYGGTLYQAANLHAVLATKNWSLFELPIENGAEGQFDVDTKDVIRIDSEGYVHGPEKPGLAFGMDWDQVENGTEAVMREPLPEWRECSATASAQDMHFCLGADLSNQCVVSAMLSQSGQAPRTARVSWWSSLAIALGGTSYVARETAAAETSRSMCAVGRNSVRYPKEAR